MRLLSLSLLLLSACAASRPVVEANQPAPRPEVSLPDGWTEVPIDGTSVADTVMILQGPHGDSLLAPTIEIGHRALTAATRRRKPGDILQSFVTEMAQAMDGFEILGAPEPVKVDGLEGARLNAKFAEGLADGKTAERQGRYYVVYGADTVWVIRCVAGAEASPAADFDAIVGSLSFS